MWRGMIRSGLVVLAVGMMAAPAARAQEESHLGTYEYVSGKDASGEISKERLSGTIRVAEARIYLVDQEGKDAFAISYVVDSEEAPFKVSMKIERSVMEDAVGATAKGLAKHEGDAVTLIYDFGENADYPDDFEPEGQQHVFVFKKKAAE